MQAIANTHHAEAWNGWEGVNWANNAARYNAIVAAFDDDLFRVAAIHEDDHVLDIGCGTGQPTLMAARRASRGDVFGVDISAPMLERARADAAEQGIANVRFEQGDAQVHPFPRGGFDVAISRGGVMFFGDPVAGFANIRRALRPGGRLVFMSPQGGTPDSDYARATAALKPLMRGPSPAARGMGSLVDSARIHEVLGEAGFAGVSVTPVRAPMDYGRDAADAAEFILGQGPVRFNLEGVDQAVVERTREELRAGLRAYETSEGVRIPGAVWLVEATRP
ncbi:class I SAM-dependent methyltransferase [Streptosporangium sp. 'caverna']|uniref:class I SAM-dependent methyltransferase n=1 Tax=Streptosporangium sp. 'caverna' TaxID=2202249 RepID=UPI000D7E9FB1|nr:class I SAM-dependent methyltransferase [Streptosporangium sp. 'caverna']AWS42568.1 type 11 methyltransferase [Streptosporangium sp. 'caverna']